MKIQNTTRLLYSILFVLITSVNCYSQNTVSPEIQQTIVNNGVGLGSVIAVTVSWERNKSILWAILHGIFSWIYVIYYTLSR